MRFRITAICLLWCSLLASPLFASTWYVRPDGGTRFSAKMPEGQCDGTADVAYPGSGTNRHCAFNDVRFFYADGSYNNGQSFPQWGWIGKGGDTYLIHGSIADKVSYRIGWDNPKNAYNEDKKVFRGIAGDPYASGMPALPSGTPTQHTRLLGANYASCHAPDARTQLHGGYAVGSVVQMSGVSYVDIACLDITDFSACGRASQSKSCDTNLGTLSDFAGTGISWSNSATHDTVTDVRIHGMGGAAMLGATGDDVHMDYIDMLGNAGAGWNADSGNGQSGNGTLLVEHFNISWNGCAEEYPIKDAVPYGDCTDDNSGGYGDGFGTATALSKPGWKVTFDHGIASYNTQDGLDALHIYGQGSTMTVSHTLAFGNMGQQIKVGGSAGVIMDNKVVTNCNAMRQDIPGTPAGYNTKLSDYCRAADTGIAVSVNNQVPLRFIGNTIYSASATAIEVDCMDSACNASSKIDFSNNIFIGFKNDRAHGYANGGRDEYSNPIYLGVEKSPFTNAGSIYTGNTTYHANANWHCPASGEKNAHCGDPHLVDETWHNYGYGDMSPAKPGAATLKEPGGPEILPLNAKALSHVVTRVRLRYVACACAGALGMAGWQALRSRQDR